MEDKYYPQISLEDYKKRRETDPDGFTDNEIHQLNKFKPSQRGDISGISIFKDGRTFFVYKRTDEWFLVKSHFVDHDPEFYKCDQFNGLLKFLEEKAD